MIFFYCAKLVIIAVKNDISVRLHRRKDLCFCLQNSVSVSKIFQMAGSDICNDTGFRLCNFCKSGHFAKITDSHFQNCDLILISQSEYSKRKPQLIIKIPLGFQCSVLFLQNRGNNFFCTCFSHTSGNSHNRNLKLLQIKFCNILYCLKRRFYMDISVICPFLQSLRKGCKTALFHYIRNKPVSIHPLSHNGNKKSSCFRFSAVRGHRRHFPVQKLFRSMVSTAAYLCYIS